MCRYHDIHINIHLVQAMAQLLPVMHPSSYELTTFHSNVTSSPNMAALPEITKQCSWHAKLKLPCNQSSVSRLNNLSCSPLSNMGTKCRLHTEETVNDDT